MSAFLSDAWLAELVDTKTAIGGVSGVVHLKTEGGPDGKTAHAFTLSDGDIVGAEARTAKGSDVELTAPYPLVVDLLTGRADPTVEFMRGALKMSGDMTIWLQLLPLAEQDGLATAAAPIVETTEF